MKISFRIYALAAIVLFANRPGVSLAACLAPPSGLVSWWSGDDAAYDLKGFNHGVLRSGAGYADGKVGRGFNFNGTSNYVQSTSWGLTVGPRDFTITGWAKTTATKNLSALVGFEGRAPALYITGPSGALYLYPTSAILGSGFNDGQFHHFAVVRTGGAVSYFKDGVVLGTTPYADSLTASRVLIGASGLAGEEFQGVIDEVAFYERALSTNEVNAIFAAGTEGMCKPAAPSLPYFIEAEDFDFNGGQHKAEADSMPYLGDAYAGLSATAEIDYHDPGANENAGYRPASQSVALFGTYDTYRDSYAAPTTFKVAYCDAGDWFNYTRVFPAPGRSYRIFARLASGAAANAIQLDEVTSGLGSSNQTLVKIGRAIGPASGGWDTFNSVPVTDDAGNPVIVNYAGEKTIRVTILPGGNEDFNYLQFVPMEASNNTCVTSATGLVAWWPGDGHRLDLQGTNHGTLLNGVNYAASRVGEGFLFDGANDSVETTLDVQPSAMPATTWECWVYPALFDPYRRQILSSDDGSYDRSVLIENGSFGVFVGYGVWYPVGLTPNQWQHIAVVFTTNNVEFYKNGVRFSYGTAAVGGATGSKLRIGSSPIFGEYFQGRIDEVGIYNRALAPAEISAIYNAANAGRCKTTSPCPVITLTPATLPAFELGSPFSQGFNASGGVGPYTFTAMGALPSALSLSSNGVLSGTLMSVGQFAFTIRVADNNGCTTPQSFTLNVVPRAPPCPDLPAGIASWWRAEGNAGDAIGVSTGTSLNGVTFAPGKVGQAFSFSSATNRVPVATNGLNVGAGDFTLEGWIKTTSVKDFNAILGFDGYNPAIFLRGDGRPQFYPNQGAAVGGFNDGRFHHFAVTRVNGQVTYYKDGFAAGTVVGLTPLNAQTINLGSDLVSGDQFDGLLDELTFYNRALTATEVRAVYSQDGGGKCGPAPNTPTLTNLVADYRFDYALNSSMGNPPNLQPINGTTFTNVAVDGSLRPVLAFPVGSGLSFAPTTGLVTSNNYSVVVLLRFDAVNGYRRILDTYGGTSEEGLYSQDGGLRFYPGGYYGANPPIAAGQWVQVVFTRGAENFMEGYVEGGLQFAAVIAAGTGVIGGNNSLRFFRDDGGDLGSGQVARIRVFSPALTPDQVAVLDRLVPSLSNPPDIAVSLPSLNFGNVNVGQSADVTLTVSNAGISTLTISSLTSNNPVFRVLSPATPLNIATGSHAVVTVRFTPIANGAQAGNLSIASNDPDQPALGVALAGSGVNGPPNPPDIALSTTSLNFGNVNVGNNSDQIVTVSNVGTSTLTISSLTTNHPAFRVLSPATPFNIAAGAQSSVTVRFTPTFAGLHSGNLAIASNDPDEAMVAVTLAGTGTGSPPNAPDIKLSATNLNFGTIAVGSSNELSITVSNVGSSTLAITALTTNNPMFRVMSPVTPVNVTAGAQTIVTLRFSPTTAGAVTGAVAIASNDPDHPTLNVALGGSGSAAPSSPPPGITAITPPNVASGSLVTIAGTNFGASVAGAVVQFGSHLATIQSLTAIQMVVRLPMTASGLVPVTVEVNGQTSDAFDFQIQPPPSSLLITEASLTTPDSLRLLAQPVWPNPSELILESADSPLGPWFKEPVFARNPVPGGQEFVTPRRAFDAQRFYRVGASASQSLPQIRIITPNINVRPGQSVTLFGANFDPAPAGNLVSFELPGQSWTATVTQAATNLLVITAPPDLLTLASGNGLLYQVRVTTSQGTGNGVGCYVLQIAANTLMLAPQEAYIDQPPGSGKKTLAIGGGVPPYFLVPQTTNELAIAVATLNGLLVEVVAKTNTKYGSITIKVEDSSVPPNQTYANVGVLSLPFGPTMTSAFHTLLGGSAPGLTMNIQVSPSSQCLKIESVQFQLQNAGLEVSRLRPGQVAGLIKLYYSSTIYGFQHLAVTEVLPGRAKFDVLSLSDGPPKVIAQGELIENPPAIVMNVANLAPASRYPQPVHEELIFADDLFRLPAGAGQNFSVTAGFTSVSVREDAYLPQQSSATNYFTTAPALAAGAPQIDRLLPVQGGVGRVVRIRGTGFAAGAPDNSVSFAGGGGTRVPAPVTLVTNNELTVLVPRDAVTGPVRLSVAGKAGNDFTFFVRFHPDAMLLFNSGIANGVPTAPNLIHQQAVDEGETTGEVPIQSVTYTLDSGQLAVAGLTTNQPVGTANTVNLYTGRSGTNTIVYQGQELQPPQRHIFEVRVSSYVLSRLYASDNPTNGVTFHIQSPDGIFQFNPGIVWDYQFTAPIYLPTAGSGGEVGVRAETVSRQWMSVPGNEMRRTVESIQPVQ